MVAIIISLVLILFGIYSVLPFEFPMGLNWGNQVIDFLKGVAPLLAFFIGFIALLIGIADIKDKAEEKKEEKKASENKK